MEAPWESVATGALNPVLGKLATILSDEYKCFKGVRGEIVYLIDELRTMYACLQHMSEEKEHIQDKVLMNEVRKLSYNMNDSIDDLMKRVNGKNTKPNGFTDKVKDSLGKMGKIKDRHGIGNEIKDLKKQIIELLERTAGYRAFSNTKKANVDPRILAMFNHASELVGIDKPKAKIIKMLTQEDGVPSTQPQQMKMVSIVGSGGMGKTTLANQLYQDLKGKFDCGAFISVSRNPNMRHILRVTLSQLVSKRYADTEAGSIEQLISRISNFLEDKRYIIVIDDIWDQHTWRTIKLAFPNNNNGSQLITTTRIVGVSKACCSSANDSIHQMEPLSDDDSKILLYDRLFGSVSSCPHEFEQVSSDILKKCGGAPLAIIAMASILTGDPWMKPKDEWHVFLKSIGRGLTNECWTNMKIILSLSYNDLPSFSKTCLLYLSTFPGSHVIERYRLVKKCIVEKIVPQRAYCSLEEVVRLCLDQLVNVNVIQPLECNNNGEVITYHIHPMMHDFLKAIAIEDKFAASLDNKDMSRTDCSNFRRLSIDCPSSENLTDLSKSMAFNGGVYSLTIFGHANRFLLKHFKGIRILDLEGCKSIERADVEYICSMILLQHLCLAKIDITELPSEIGNLKYLEGLDIGGSQITHLPTQIGKLQHLKTLDARSSRVKDLPDQVVGLTRLVRLLIGDNESSEGVKLPDGIGKLISLQQLGTIDLRKCSVSSLKELGELPHLKQIEVVSSDEPEDTRKNNTLLSSLGMCTELRSLVVHSNFRLSKLRSSSPYKCLNCRKKLTLVRRSFKVPIRIAEQYVVIRMLDVRVCKLEEDGLKILRELPRLQTLIVRLEVLPTKMIPISCEGFSKLESFYVDCRMPRVIFEEGAMQKLEHLELKLYAGSASEEHMSIKHLLNLQKVTLRYAKWYATNKGVRETIDTVKTEAKEHPNKITVCIAEEDKDGKCTMRTEIFQENKYASCSRITEIEEERDGHADGTGHFLDTQEAELHQSNQSNHAIASCSGTSEIEEVVE